MHPAQHNSGRLPGATRGICESPRPTWGAAVALLIALTAAGCQTAPRCETLSKCGGDLKSGAIDGESEWVATAQDACMDQLQLPVNPVSLSQQPAKTAGKKSVAPATADWCASLLQKSDGTLKFQGYFPIIPLENAVLTLEPQGEFLAHFLAFAPQKMVFSAACRAAQGISATCPELGRHIAAAIATESNVYFTRCSDDSEGGCLCEYDLRLFTSVPGTWGASDDGIVTFYDNSFAPSPPAPADYCLNGDSLEMTGHNGLSLFNRPNLRTLQFHRPTCSDGVQSHALGEEGIDCGGQCPPCVDPMCNDNVQNVDETGVDCGGEACKDFCGCFNQIQDPWEEGADCGGPCSLLCQCTNRVQDAGETGVDCGGVCVARYNQGEPVPCP